MTAAHLLAAFLSIWFLDRPEAQFPLEALTVRGETLPAGCVVVPSNTQELDRNRVRTGLWAGLPISTNPWTGNEPTVVIAIRERLQPAARMVDGPPLSKRELARARMRLAEDVEAAYVAVYTDADDQLITVYALRFTTDTEVVTRVTGPAGECRDAVMHHIKSVVP